MKNKYVEIKMMNDIGLSMKGNDFKRLSIIQ